MIKRPMLAFRKPEDWSDKQFISQLRYPLLATPKLDGIRCLIVNGVAVSRKLLPIPNALMRDLLSRLPEGFDGELLCPGGFNATQSAVMSHNDPSPFNYTVFDCYSSEPYFERVANLVRWHRVCPCPWVSILVYNQIDNEQELLSYEAQCLEAGYEGVCLRTPLGPYKFGRSTFGEHYLLKLKRFQDSEATILDFEEQLHNRNEQTTNELGLSKRSSHQTNLVAAGVLGALRVQDVTTGAIFCIGSGFDDAQRHSIWLNRGDYLGKVITYKFQPSGMLNLPRFPVFKGFRND